MRRKMPVHRGQLEFGPAEQVLERERAGEHCHIFVAEHCIVNPAAS